MNVTLEGNEVVIRIARQAPVPTKSGKNPGKNSVAVSSRGFAPTGLELDGKPLSLSVTGIIPS